MTGPLVPGRLVRLAPGVRRLVAPNPGIMTGPGTNAWILGDDEIAVLDPGPAIDAHVEALLAATAGRLRRILVTHTHTDHSPAAAPLAAATGAEIIGRAPPVGPHQDATFRPDRLPDDGEAVETPEFTLEVVATPGHASNHLCYRHTRLKWLFTGDHIIDGSTVVIDPPDGNMRDYLASLDRLKRLELAAIAPGHGRLIRDPRRAIDAIIEHRLAREAKVLAAVRAQPGRTAAALVPRVYREVDAALHALAERSLLAHLEKLEGEASVTRRGERWFGE